MNDNMEHKENAGARMPFVCPCMYNTYTNGAYGQNMCPFMCCPFMNGAFMGGSVPQYNMMFGRRESIPFPESQE